MDGVVHGALPRVEIRALEEPRLGRDIVASRRVFSEELYYIWLKEKLVKTETVVLPGMGCRCRG
jgi:hypothetical protein